MCNDEKDLDFHHLPVMLAECVEALAIDPDGIYVDCTAGGGGHSAAIAARLRGGRLIAIDRDGAAIRAAGARLAPFGERVTLVQDNFLNLSDILSRLGVGRVNGVLADLGVSSYQLDTAERGFSYMKDAPLDMRMNRDDTLTAYDVINGYGESELKRILYEYGEERLAPKIVSAIQRERDKAPIKTTGELAELICSVYPPHSEGHPAKRTFQAVRIEVNHELDCIPPAIEAACDALAPGGRLAVITFHSLEDRAVKNAITALAGVCTCPPDFPVCVCGCQPRMKPINRKPILPGEDEMRQNPRAKSAKLRVAARTDIR